MNNSILVTGGAGFIGSSLVRLLLRDTDTRVVNLDKLTYAGSLDTIPPSEEPRHQFVHGDICDERLLAEVFTTHQPQAVVHLAAESHVDRSIDGPREFVKTNVAGTFELLLAALHYWERLPAPEKASFRFVHVSTDEVYGSLGPEGRFSEESRYDPHSPYSASKAASDHFVRAFHGTYGFPTLVTNCSNNYGPYQYPEKLIPLMTLNALQDKPLPVYGSGANVRDWLFVEDHCRALLQVLESGQPGETYNIGAGDELSNLEVVRQICTVVDEIQENGPNRSCHRLIEFVEDRPGHDSRYAIDNSKIVNELGWHPRVSFESGLRNTVAWYAKHRDWIKRMTHSDRASERRGLRRTLESRPLPAEPEA